jgi:hypothetical protein
MHEDCPLTTRSDRFAMACRRHGVTPCLRLPLRVMHKAVQTDARQWVAETVSCRRAGSLPYPGSAPGRGAGFAFCTERRPTDRNRV